MFRLDPRIRHYAWGSDRALAQLSARPFPTPQLEAELWMGAHEGDPAGVVVDGSVTTLDALIASNPQQMLGEAAVARFGHRLPYLLKVLAPARPLSLQAHPAEHHLASADPGTYGDDRPKPEALLTLSDYELFAGSLSLDQVAQRARALGVGALIDRVESATSCHELLGGLLGLPVGEQRTLCDTVVKACVERRTAAPEFDAIARVSAEFPGDFGVVVLLTMGYHHLPAGHYVRVPAGALHTSVRGLTVEVQANSDNVVRAGLTPKETNVAELLRIVDTEVPISAHPLNDFVRVQSLPADTAWFGLHRILPGDDPVDLPAPATPRIVLAIGGSLTLRSGDQSLTLGPACSAFVPACAPAVTCSGDATAYVATTGNL
ncbi:mannose-6-phosphate isomerase, class I [Calidifontibacter terrae]